MTARSSSLSIFAKHCPHALTLQETHVPYPRDVFGAGIAAHAILQEYAGHALTGENFDPDTVGRSVVVRLSTEGRSFDGHPEPPIPIEACLDGLRLGSRWWEMHEFPASARIAAEIGLSVNEQWEACDYRDPSAWYRGILDLTWDVYEDNDEGAPFHGVAVRDYKSAWPTDESELETLQFHGYALLVVAHFTAVHRHAPDFVRLDVGNLRTTALYTDTIWLDEAGAARLSSWQADLDTLIRAANIQPRKPNPGPRCLGCPFVLGCDYAQAWYASAGISMCTHSEFMTPERIASYYAVSQARADALKAMAREACAEASVSIPGGSVGFHVREKRQALPTAGATLARRWFRVPDENAESWEAEHSFWLGFLGALGLGSGNVEKAATALHPGRTMSGRLKDPDWKANRPALIESCTTLTTSIEFGIKSDASTPTSTDGNPDAQAQKGDSV